MTKWAASPIPDETPFDPSGFKHRGKCWTREELAPLEAKNIAQATLKYLASRPSAHVAPFEFDWLLTVHREMLGDVWEWAGTIRTLDLTVGVPHYMVREELMKMLDNLSAWGRFGHSIEWQAVRIHHEAVKIHPFRNGNGRWARLLANIWLRRHGRPIVEWPNIAKDAQGGIREEYLVAVKAADRLQFGPLTKLHEQFQSHADEAG